MGYINCPNCKSPNKDTDTKCYSCEQALEPAPAVTPSHGQPSKNAAQANAAGGVVTAANMDRTSNWMQGLRAGVKVGLVGGIFCSLLSILHSTGENTALVAALVLLGNVAYAAVIGVCAGQLDALCYRYDAIKVGSTLGFLYAIKTFDLYGIITGGAFGGFVGACCSFVEKRRRGQHAELW